MNDRCPLYASVDLENCYEASTFFRRERILPEFLVRNDYCLQPAAEICAGFLESFEHGEGRITCHAPPYDVALHYRDRDMIKISSEKLHKSLEIAHGIGAGILVVHFGYEHRKHYPEKKAWLKRSGEFLGPLVEEARRLKIKIALENLVEEDPEALVEFVDSLGSPNLGFCFDVGHFNIFSKASLDEWLDGMGDRLYEVHIHDNRGDFDYHLPPGSGRFDFPLFFRRLERFRLKPLLVLEMHTVERLAGALKYMRSEKMREAMAFMR